jgi:hypothetical protein
MALGKLKNLMVDKKLQFFYGHEEIFLTIMTFSKGTNHPLHQLNVNVSCAHELIIYISCT